MSGEKEERAELIRRGQILESKLKYLSNELEKLGLIMIELQKAKASISSLEKGNETLVGLGGDVLGIFNVSEIKFFFPLGAGYYLKVGREEALERVEKMLNSIEDNHKRLREEIKKSEKELVELIRDVNSS